MKFETLARRVAEKVGFPPLEEALLNRDASLIPEDKHLIWTGKKTQEGLKMRMVRDHNMRPEILPVDLQPFGQITFNKKVLYVQRLVFDRVFGMPPDGRLKNLCGHTLCVNPHHWLLKAQPELEPPEYSSDWTVEDAVIALGLYPRDDPEFDDMPEDIMQLALKELNL